MHPSHLPLALALVLALLPPTLTLTLPDPRPHHQQQQSHQIILLDPRSPAARQRRLEAWEAQKPMHTTALLAGAAATAVPEAQLREGRRRDLSGVTGERGMWVPVQFWDGGDEGDGKGVRGGDVRGEKVLVADFEAELEEKEDEDVELQGKIEGYGVRDVLERVWKTVEKIGTVVRRRKQRMERDKELDNGHDGDL